MTGTRKCLQEGGQLLPVRAGVGAGRAGPGPHGQRPAMRETPRPAGETLALVDPGQPCCRWPRFASPRWGGAAREAFPRPAAAGPALCRAGSVSPVRPGPRSPPAGACWRVRAAAGGAAACLVPRPERLPAGPRRGGRRSIAGALGG